ncbi:SdrD B-like domain-containing protein [Runella sp. SP2]|uniref:SdrD B-like domain-containing protein n=1 Tax=Runella sp. SP2 TaxID=2268026 RepID=UPI000F08581C|nr:SdrD B-like domain-containing protein [Runella sp. SP2]AYQ35590.1 DUF11 domain-containing protein [Runella sp. SP2]
MAILHRIHQREYATWFVQYSIKTFALLGILLGSFQFVQAQQCSITINKVTVSGCYLLSGQSKATVSIEVGWSGAPANDSIEVTLGTDKRYIRPGTFAVKYPATTVMGNQTIVTPQVIAFEVNATGNSLPITATFTTQASCSATSTAQLPAACPPLVCSGNQAGGTVFNDYDADGVKDAGESNGVAGVTVIAYDCTGGIAAQTTTDASGKYVLNVSVSDYPIRVEFVNLPSYAGKGTMQGADSRTTVQFVTAPDCTIDLGILDNNDYCQTTPQVVVPCYVYGKPDVGSLSGQMDALVAFDYGTTGPKDMSKIALLAKAEEVGTLWGVAYDRYKHKVYTSATLKRHAGLGPLGLGGIYVTDMAANTASQYVDVSQPPLNINVGATNAGDPWFGVTNASRGLNPDPAQPSADSLAFELIGKVGMGDLEISEDGKSLYFINLFDKKLYQIDISGAAPSLLGSWAIPDPGCTGGTLRPFATKVYKGKVYIGSVCDASTSTKSNLRGFVNAFDGTNFTQVFDFPLTYPKGAVLINNTPAVVDRVGWYPWTDSFNTVNSNTTNGTFIRVLYPQPMLTDIEFDIDGSMVLALGDRTGLQSGYNNYRPSGTGVYTGLAGGDVLRAAFTNGTFILENNGKVPGLSGSGVNNNQGPGFGEFYNDDFLGGNGGLTHAEIAFGALALKPGSGQVITTAMDPIDQNQTGTNFSGGIRYWSNTTGLAPSGAAMGFVLYNTNNEVGTFGKSTGLGDMEILCELPMYLELGNYVWNDANKNGVQDPCEKALKDINVTLYKGTTKIATTKTGTNGEYYFSTKSNLTTGTWEGTGADTTLLPNTAYKLVFGEGQLVGGKLTVAGLGQFDVTLKDATANSGNDQNDSDAEVISGAFCINLTTGNAGSVNHTFDAGFYCTNPSIGASSIAVTAPKCAVTVPQNDGKISLSSAIAPYDKYRTKMGTGAWSGDTTYATATAIGSTFPKDLVTGISNAGATYTIRFYNGECCYKDTTITIAPVACCVLPVASATPQKQTICVGGIVSAFTATPSTGVEYKWYGPLADTTSSLGTAVSGATSATFTPSGAALTTVGTKYYAVVVNTTGDANCADTVFVQLVVNAKPVIADGSATICAGDSVDLTSKITNYDTYLSPVWTVGTANGTVVTTPASVKPTGTTTYVLVAQNAAGCKDTANVVVTVNIKPNAGKDTTLACVNAATNTLSTSYTLVPNPSGGSWSQLGTTPTTATISGNDVTGMSVAGTYQFIYTSVAGCKDTIAVTVAPCPVCVKPDAGADAASVCQPTSTSKLTAVTTGGTWAPIASPANPSAATIDANGNISGLNAAGTYKFVFSITSGGQTCTDTAQVIVLAKPVIADGSATICAGESVDLTSKITNYDTYLSPVWTIETANGTAVATPNSVKPTGTTTYVLVAQNAAGCKDTANVVVTVNAKPNAGNDTTLVCANGSVPSSVQLSAAPTGGTWSALTGNPTGATISSSGLVSITNATAQGKSFDFIYTLNDCQDTVKVIVPVCVQPKGSIGDYVWKDQNDNGVQDSGEPAVAGVIVQLLNPTTSAVLATDTTDAQGLYLFPNLNSGTYQVKIVTTSLPAGCVISSKQDLGGDDTKDSDFDPTTGLSQTVTINATGTGITKDNPTVDAGLVVPCVASSVTLTDAPVCSADVQTYSITFNVSNKLGIVKVNKGTLSGNNPYTVTGIPSGASVIITDSLSAICKSDTTIVGPNCNCNPPVPVLLAPSMAACIGDTFPTLKATVVGLVTVEWFSQQTGGTVLSTGLNYKPSGTVTANTVFYAQARSTDPTCPTAVSTSRVPATINAQTCIDTIDLALKKSINTKIARVGDVLTYTIKVWNEWNKNATGVEVTDSIATTVQFVSGSFVTSRGSATISGNVIKWNIGNVAANGDTVTLRYQVKATQVGVHLNTAEISKTNEKDKDSTPGNGKGGEDDIDQQCFTVPFDLCPNQKLEVSVPATLTNVQWFKNGGTTAVATGNVVLFSEVGTYTFTATNQTCPANGCCPVIIEAGTNCCPVDICVPFTIKKKRK